MKAYLISYDLGVPEGLSDYDAVIKYIKSLGKWAKPLKSQWFVVADISCSEIRDGFRSLTDSNDKILVMDVTDDDWSTLRISDDVTSWMKNNLQ